MIPDVLRSLWRKWYISLPGVLLAGVLAAGAWLAVPPSYERSASQFLVPPQVLLPGEEATNPYMYLGGLTYAADVLVRAVGSENVRAEIARSYDDVEVEVRRDPSTAGPVILIIVTAPTDEVAGDVLEILLERTRTELSDIQVEDVVSASQQITVQPISVDQHGKRQQRTRLMAAVGAAGFVSGVAVVLAVAVDGLSGGRPRHS